MKRAILFWSAAAALFFALAAVQFATAADKICPTTYANFGQAFMEKYCLMCHDSGKKWLERFGAPKDLNFNASDDVKKNKAGILKMVVVEGSMPPFGHKPPADEKAKLKEWLDCEY